MIRFTPAGAQVLPRCGDDGRSSIVDRMAETIREIGSGATFDDLVATGYYTADEIRRHGMDAAALAAHRFFGRTEKPRRRVPAGSHHVAA